MQPSFSPSNESKSPGARFFSPSRILIASCFTGLAVLAGYSLHVAWHEADPQETVLLGQSKLASGSPAALRVVVRQRTSEKPVLAARVEISLRGDKSTTTLGRFATGKDGSISEPLVLPELSPGPYTLIVDARSRLGRDHIERRVEIYRPAQVLLTTDKPVYQPGQTIHLRALVTNGRTLKPFAGENITFEISDAKGNKVFKELRKASAFGIASVDFDLATELNVGRYQVRAVTSSTTAERTVEVKRYVLPKFKMNIATGQSWYRPGQSVTGTLVANYFFGKPVSRAKVRLTAETMHEQAIPIGTVNGTTDAEGRFTFQLPLPAHFTGVPQKDGQAFLELTAEVRDTGGHAETTTRSLTVSANDLELTVLPEGGLFVPGVENWLYVLAAYPDGRPAKCEISGAEKAFATDEQGVGVLAFTPSSTNVTLTLTARDVDGKTATATFNPTHDATLAPLLLRSDKAVYQAGQTARFTVLARDAAGTVFLDVLRDRQTVLTRSLPLKKGRGELSLDLPPDLVGALKVNAYLITGTGEDRGCSRLVYVNPAGGLRIETKSDQPVYRPGETARLQFTVRDASGKPAPAALGLSVVDESVFALQENQPGLLAQFLGAEGDLLKPRHQIKFFNSPGQLLAGGAKSDLLAHAYFSTTSANLENQQMNLEKTLGEYLRPGSFDQLRTMRGTSQYEQLKQDPEWGSLLRQVEGGAFATDGNGAAYDLREATGPAKQSESDKRKREYFAALKKAGFAGAVGFLLLCPLLCVLVNVFSGVKAQRQVGRQIPDADQRRLITARAHHYIYAGLTVLPFALYPLLIVSFEAFRPHGMKAPPFVWMLGLECVLAVAACGWLLRSTANLGAIGVNEKTGAMKARAVIFAAHFVLVRLLLMAGPNSFGNIFFLALFGVLLMPWILLAESASSLESSHRKCGVELPPQPMTATGALGIIGVVVLLALLAIPNFVKARTTAQTNAAVASLKQIDGAMQQWALENKQPFAVQPAEITPSPRLRRHFPETLYWRPELITDDHGKVSLEIPLADSITTWRASLDAINSAGRFGSAEVPLRVFQDVFVELDLPVSLSLGDQVTIPVLCHNYLSTPQTIKIQLEQGDWFILQDGASDFHSGPSQRGEPKRPLSPTLSRQARAGARRAGEGARSTNQTSNRIQTITLAANEVRAVHFPIEATRVGGQRLCVTAQGAKVSDAVEREVRVLPTGLAVERLDNGVLKDRASFDFALPADAIPGSAELVAKFYPSRFSEIVEGLESIFQAPNGCFEQTSSTTYPNVLALDYLKGVNRLTPEIEARARKFINAGYQRLLTFEVTGGGFEWFGRPPAHVCLTAYGVLEFTDMARVQTVDPDMMKRTVEWLGRQQNGDGSFGSGNGAHQWVQENMLATAYVAWALAEARQSPASLEKALAYLQANRSQLDSHYLKALAANAALSRSSTDGFGQALVNELMQSVQGQAREQCFWDSTGRSVTHSSGDSLRVETTALAALALMKSRSHPQTVKGALQWLSAAKGRSGCWPTTQSTILAMRALIKGSSAPLGQSFTSTIKVMLNAQEVEAIRITQDNADVVRMASLTKHLRAGENRLELRQEPPGELPFQVAGAFWRPASNPPVSPAESKSAEPLRISLQYDRTSLAVDDELKCAVTVQNNTPQSVPMAMVDLGIPPGFEVDASAFESLRAQGRLEKFELTGNQVVLYLRELPAGAPLQFSYTMRAKYPLRVETPRSAVYEYYNPKNRAESASARLQVVRQ
jgi:uncharacterized protein YfaS (alpha-2-macroglobulin family)